MHACAHPFAIINRLGYASQGESRHLGWQIERRAGRRGQFRRAGQHLALPLCSRGERRRGISDNLCPLCPAAGIAAHDRGIHRGACLAPQRRGCLPGAEPAVELPGIQRRAGGIPDSGFLLRGFGLDGGIHDTLGDGQLRPRLGRRGVQGYFRNVHQQPLATRIVYLPLRAGHPFRNRLGRTERHRTLGQDPHAAAAAHPDRAVDPLAADAGRGGRAEVPLRPGFLEGNPVDGARRTGAGLLLALDRHRHDGDLRLVFQTRHEPAPHGAQRHDPRHAGGRTGRRGDLPGRVQRRYRTHIGPGTGLHHPAEHLQQYAAEHGLVVDLLPAAGRRSPDLDHLAARSGHGLPARGVAPEPQGFQLTIVHQAKFKVNRFQLLSRC